MRYKRPLFAPHIVGCLLLLAATLGAARLAEYRRADSLASPLDTIGRTIAGWSATDNPALTEGVLGQLKPTSYLSRTYRKGESTLDLFIAYYANQRAGESMHSPKHCLPGAGWEIWNAGSEPIPVGGRTEVVNRYGISRDGRRMVVLYWYQSRDRIVASEYLGKFLLAKDALLRNSTAGSIVRIIVPDDPQAVQAAVSVAATLIPQVSRCFGG